MDAANQGAADGSIGVDPLWKRKLSKLLADTPLSPNLLEAAAPLVHLLPDAERRSTAGVGDAAVACHRGHRIAAPSAAGQYTCHAAATSAFSRAAIAGANGFSITT